MTFRLCCTHMLDEFWQGVQTLKLAHQDSYSQLRIFSQHRLGKCSTMEHVCYVMIDEVVTLWYWMTKEASSTKEIRQRETHSRIWWIALWRLKEYSKQEINTVDTNALRWWWAQIYLFGYHPELSLYEHVQFRDLSIALWNFKKSRDECSVLHQISRIESKPPSFLRSKWDLGARISLGIEVK